MPYPGPGPHGPGPGPRGPGPGFGGPYGPGPGPGRTGPPPFWNFFSPRYHGSGGKKNLGCFGKIFKWLLIIFGLSCGLKIIVGLVYLLVT